MIAGYADRQKSVGWAADNKFADCSVWGLALIAQTLDGQRPGGNPVFEAGGFCLLG